MINYYRIINQNHSINFSVGSLPAPSPAHSNYSIKVTFTIRMVVMSVKILNMMLVVKNPN